MIFLVFLLDITEFSQILHFCSSNSREIVQREEFLHLELGQLVNLLKCDEIVVKSEEQVYEYVLAWIQFDLDDRQQYLAEIMADVHFPMMHKEYLALRVLTEPLVRNNPYCMDFITEALKYHLFKGDPSLSVHSARTRPRLNWIKHLLIVSRSTNSVELYDLRDGRVQQGADMPMNRFRCV